MENQEEYEEQIDRIRRYQDSVIRHAKDENHTKLQYYIEKLRMLPIRYEHLEETRVGNTVNQLRSRFDGETKELAKKCVNEWKEIVAEYQAEQARQEEEEAEAAAAAAEAAAKEEEAANKKRLMKEEQERKDRERRNENASHSRHHGEASTSRHKDSESKHKSHKRSHSSGEDHHSKKPKKDHHHDKDKHHKSHDHSSKHDEQKKKHRSDEDRHKTKSKESKDKHKEHTKKDKTSSDSKSKDSSKDKDKTSSSSSSSKSKSVINVVNGIDSGSGASFAEALGMCEPTGSKSSPAKKEVIKKKSPSSSSHEKKSKSEREKPSSSSSGGHSSSSSLKKHSKSNHSSPLPPNPNDSLPKLLKEPAAALEPVDLNISSLLPTITPNYRPLGTMTMSDIASKRISDYEALSNIITSKNQRTKVYSGNKTAHGIVPSLFDICIRILQDNIDSLEYTGGVPYLILKPILDKASPNQLYLLENYNPYLIEDTDGLWHLHCQKDFRNKNRLELESWREMYLRCVDEREAKLVALTANIKQAQDKSVPLRKAKLAFVDDIVKPPRNIARQQAKNGTGTGKQFDKRPLVTPSSRLSTLNALATSGEAGKVSVPNPGARAAERSSASVKPAKKAPLMAKSISLLKNRFKR